MEFQPNDMVIYGIHGVCRILQVEERKVDRKIAPYFVLEPIEQVGTRFYIPVENPAALAKLKKMLSREALLQIIHDDAIRQDAWIVDENRRKQCYRELIGRGDRKALLNMVYTLHAHRKQHQSIGKKLHQCDENFLRDAEKLLAGEISLVLDMPKEQVGQYLQSELTKSI